MSGAQEIIQAFRAEFDRVSGYPTRRILIVGHEAAARYGFKASDDVIIADCVLNDCYARQPRVRAVIPSGSGPRNRWGMVR